MSDNIQVSEHHGGNRSWRTYVTPGKGLEVHLHGPTGDLQHVRSFKVGDEAEYDSFWVSSDGPLCGYTHFLMGLITQVSSKTVTIQPNGGGRNRRVKLGDFSFRNWNEKSPRNV